ncbi:MAG TPA: amidohydrolase family protein [Candidatus Acidoferrales bacterium]|nr:amidohydrolase family protein [Candidatus Acidoferrales bacterium]
MTPYRLLDADSHVSEPLNLWRERLPERFRDKAPRMLTEYKGKPGAWWLIEEDREPHNVILGFGANKTLEELQQFLQGFSYAGAHRGGWDPAQRLKDMDRDGVAGDVLYTTLGFRMFWIRDADFQRACFQVYNDWLAEFCSYAPARLKGVALISLYDPRQAAADLERCVNDGLAGALIWASPPAELPFYSEIYDPFWAAAQELGVPLSIHEFAGFERIYWESTPERRAIAGAVASHEVETTFATFILSGILERFPRLRIISAELNCGWLAYFLYRMDKTFASRGERLRGSPFATKLSLKPSDYFHRQMYATFIDDAFGIAHRDEIGVDNLLWSSDFPHSATFWPHSQEKVAADFAAVGEEDKRKILRDNTAQLYRFDLA